MFSKTSHMNTKKVEQQLTTKLKKIDDFLQLASEFNKVDAAATRQRM